MRVDSSIFAVTATDPHTTSPDPTRTLAATIPQRSSSSSTGTSHAPMAMPIATSSTPTAMPMRADSGPMTDRPADGHFAAAFAEPSAAAASPVRTVPAIASADAAMMMRSIGVPSCRNDRVPNDRSVWPASATPERAGFGRMPHRRPYLRLRHVRDVASLTRGGVGERVASPSPFGFPVSATIPSGRNTADRTTTPRRAAGSTFGSNGFPEPARGRETPTPSTTGYRIRDDGHILPTAGDVRYCRVSDRRSRTRWLKRCRETGTRSTVSLDAVFVFPVSEKELRP
ncbi:hypothetical protein STSO111631_23915 [Stackebrandtia soli]